MQRATPCRGQRHAEGNAMQRAILGTTAPLPGILRAGHAITQVRRDAMQRAPSFRWQGHAEGSHAEGTPCRGQLHADGHTMQSPRTRTAAECTSGCISCDQRHMSLQSNRCSPVCRSANLSEHRCQHLCIDARKQHEERVHRGRQRMLPLAPSNPPRLWRLGSVPNIEVIHDLVINFEMGCLA